MTTPIYTPQTWVNGEAGNTPLSDSRLQHIEDGIHNASLTANAAAALLPPAGTDLLGALNAFVAPLTVSQAYREPTGTEQTNGVNGLLKMPLSVTDATTLLSALGFTVTTGYDAVTKRPYALATSAPPTDQRAWGFYLFDTSQPINSIIACPHPVAEQNTELMAFAHWQSRPGRALFVAGAHRDAASGLADVSTHTGSLFHAICAAYASRKVIQCHWLGYADASAAGLTQIVGTGAANAGAAAIRTGLELKAAGFTIGQGWDASGSGTGLIGASNVQATDAAGKQASWIQMEVNNTTRLDTLARTKTVNAVVAAEIGTLANADGTIAAAQTLVPQSVGSANSTGVSPFGARADHVHKDNPNTLTRITSLESYRSMLPFDFNYVAWSDDPASVQVTVTPTGGVLYLQRMPVRVSGQLITNVHCAIAGTGTLTSGQNFLVLYNSAGTRLAATADMTTAFGTVGEVVGALTAAQTIATADYVYAGVLINGSVMPTLGRGGPIVSGLGNAKMTSTSKRFAQYGSAQTATPASLTLTSMANSASVPWLAVS